jgi:hypothetical protein
VNSDSLRRSLARYSFRFAQERAAAADGAGFVCSPLGAWLLVALIAPTAADPERTIEGVLGLSAEEAARLAGELLREDSGDYLPALGVWSNHVLAQAWTQLLPDGAVQGHVPELPASLDVWAAAASRGLIERFPAAEDAVRSPFVFASAVSARTTWVEPFEQQQVVWLDEELLGLGRTLNDREQGGVARTAAGEYGYADIAANDGSRVLLVIGAEHEPAEQVLAAAHQIESALAGDEASGVALFTVDDVEGDGHSWQLTEHAWSQSTAVSTVAFELHSDHDLEQAAGIAELRQLQLPGLFASGEPGEVIAAKQAAMARFHSQGFEAAAVTSMMVAMAAPGGFDKRSLHLTFSRPFAFLARDRNSLPWFAGWVVEPADEPEPQPDDFWG